MSSAYHLSLSIGPGHPLPAPKDLMEALTRRGTIVEGAADWRKGSTWVLEREDGVVVRAHAVPPPL